MLTLHVNLWPGDHPRTPRTTFPRATRRPPGMVCPLHAPGRTQEPHDQRARGTRPADRPPRPAPGSAPAGPPRLRGGRSPSLRPGRLDGIRSLPLPSGVGRRFDPGRRNGRSPCRRPGGPAPKRWQRRPSRSPVTPRGLSREADGHRPAVIGRRRENIRRRADRGDLRTATANAAGAGLCRGSEGARPPASLRRGLTECGHTEYAGLCPPIMQIPA